MLGCLLLTGCSDALGPSSTSTPPGRQAPLYPDPAATACEPLSAARHLMDFIDALRRADSGEVRRLAASGRGFAQRGFMGLLVGDAQVSDQLADTTKTELRRVTENLDDMLVAKVVARQASEQRIDFVVMVTDGKREGVGKAAVWCGPLGVATLNLPKPNVGLGTSDLGCSAWSPFMGSVLLCEDGMAT